MIRSSKLSFVFLNLLALGCSENAAQSPDTMKPDAAKSETSATHGSDSGSGPSMDASSSDACDTISAACANFDDDGGVGSLCIQVGAEGDLDLCRALSDECRGVCRDVDPLVFDGKGVDAERCDELGDSCHELDLGHGLAHLCHETGHMGKLDWCDAIWDECSALCGVDEALDAGDSGSR
jgi:hypothetical protein